MTNPTTEEIKSAVEYTESLIGTYYLAEHPEKMDEHRKQLKILLALAQAYLCKTNPTSKMEKKSLIGYTIICPLDLLFYRCPGNNRIYLDEDIFMGKDGSHIQKVCITIEEIV